MWENKECELRWWGFKGYVVCVRAGLGGFVRYVCMYGGGMARVAMPTSKGWMFIGCRTYVCTRRLERTGNPRMGCGARVFSAWMIDADLSDQ